jgi:hypothetical protein
MPRNGKSGKRDGMFNTAGILRKWRNQEILPGPRPPISRFRGARLWAACLGRFSPECDPSGLRRGGGRREIQDFGFQISAGMGFGILAFALINGLLKN